MHKENVFFTTDKYVNLKDEEIISQIRSGDKDALSYLLEKYKNLVNIKVSKYFMIGAEKEDILQEGYIGLYKAVKSYNRQKQNSFKTFAGPVDYGSLTFEYPRTWSVYVAADASSGGDFNAYFNPIQVDAVGKDTINALRVTIRNKGFDDVVEEYQKAMDKKNFNLTVESVTVGNAEKGTSVTANRYTGTIPGTDLSGYIVVFKIRDKTAILQTDSVLFKEDFDKLLGTIVFNA